jgi:hypothetical protein
MPEAQRNDHVKHLISQLDRLYPRWRTEIKPLPAEYVFGFGRFLGEYYCDWASEMLGRRFSRAMLDTLTAATMILRAVAVLKDYVADVAPTDPARYTNAAAAFREIAVTMYGETAEAGAVEQLIVAHERESDRLDADERRRHWGRIRRFDRHDMRTLARKTTLCFVPAEILALQEIDSSKARILSRLIEARNVAVQILDDISDWRVDLAVGNMTLPLWCALAPALTSQPVSIDRVKAYLYGSDALPVLIRLARHYIVLAVKVLGDHRAQSLRHYFARLDTHLTMLEREVTGAQGRTFKLLCLFSICESDDFPTIRLCARTRPVLIGGPTSFEVFDALIPRFAPRAGVT